MRAETYLGEGLYASYDGWQFVLRAPRENGDHWVALEPEMLRGLMDFVAEIKQRPSGPAAPAAEPPGR